MSILPDIEFLIDQGDTGCPNNAYGVQYPSCLNCPLPICKYEQPLFQSRRSIGITTDRLVFNAFNGQIPERILEKEAIQIAEKINVTSRTVYRSVKRIRQGGYVP